MVYIKNTISFLMAGVLPSRLQHHYRHFLHLSRDSCDRYAVLKLLHVTAGSNREMETVHRLLLKEGCILVDDYGTRRAAIMFLPSRTFAAGGLKMAYCVRSTMMSSK